MKTCGFCLQKFAYTTGKNSTDTELIIDAMDILRSRLVDGFCIVSSDSDYTGLANRVREEGLFVMGIGRGHITEAFVQACEVFVFTEVFMFSGYKGDGSRPAGGSSPGVDIGLPRLPGLKCRRTPG